MIKKEDGLLFRNGLNLDFTESIDDADLILACTFTDSKPIDYLPILHKAKDKNLIMYCANPDYETIDILSNKSIFCIGLISDMYKQMGGKVVIKENLKKTFIETTKNMKLNKKRTIAVGDSIFNDIKGANNFKIDSILVQSGIHKAKGAINKLIKITKLNQRTLLIV